MKVMMIHADKGGIAIYSQRCIEALKKQGSTVDGWVWQLGDLFDRIIYPLKMLKPLKGALNKYDVVHVQYHFAEYMFLFLPLLCLLKRKAKLVITAHEDYLNLPIFVRWFHNVFYKCADLIIVHKKSHKQLLSGQRNVQVIPLGIVNRGIERPQNDSGMIVIPGFINKWKGYHTVLEAIRKYDINKFQFIIIGKAHDKKYYEHLRSIATKNVVFIEGFVSDERMQEYFSKCEFAILPYTRITASAMLIELISYNVPAMLSDLDVFKETTNDEAAYFKAGDVNDLYAVFKGFKSKKEKVSKVFKRVAERHSWENIADTTIKEYQRLYIQKQVT